MQKLMMAALFLFLAQTAHASPKNITRIVTAAPRAVGRTAENMVTFKDHGLALNQWILMGAVLFDAKTSLDLTRRCPEPCENYGSVWGAHPSAARVYGLLGLTGIYYSTLNQVAWEVSYEETNPAGRAFERYFMLTAAVVHARLAIRNTQIHPASQTAVPPELNADHAID